MSTVTKSAAASLRTMERIMASGLYAGEDLDAVAPCYIKSDGLVYMSSGAANDEAAKFVGFTAIAVLEGEPVTLFGFGSRFRYGNDLTPGAIYYIGETPGTLDTEPTTGDPDGTAMAISATDIIISRVVPMYESGEESDPIGDALRADAVAYWKLENNLDSTIHDHNLSEIGTVNRVPGKIGNAASLTTNDNNGLMIINEPEFHSFGLQTKTFWGWAKVNDFSSNPHVICRANTKSNSGDDTLDFVFSFHDVLYVDVYNADGVEIGFLSSSFVPIDDEFFFFAFSIDVENGKILLNINDIPQEESEFFDSAVPYTQELPNYSFSLGCSVVYSSPETSVDQLNGCLNQIGCIDYTLTPQIISYLFNAGAGRTLYP